MKGAALTAFLLLAMAGGAAADSLLERGAELARGIVACGNCHTPKGPDSESPGMELAGGFVIETPQFTAFAPNITPDPETGIGGWSEDDLIRAIREGRRPDGSIIGPPMPIGLYRGLSDRDARALARWVLSRPAVRNEVPRSSFRMPLPENWGPPVANVPGPPAGDRLARGAYMAGPLGHCIECHTPFVDGHPDFENRLGAGGNVFEGPWGVTVSRNITPHLEDGLGSWTDDRIRRAITEGISADGSRLAPPMGFAYYRNIPAGDLDDLIAWLRSLPPLPPD